MIFSRFLMTMQALTRKLGSGYNRWSQPFVGCNITHLKTTRPPTSDSCLMHERPKFKDMSRNAQRNYYEVAHEVCEV